MIDRDDLEKKLSERLDQVITEVMSEYAKADGTEKFIPTHWVLIVGAQEPMGIESACTYVPKDGQPLYVSHGLIQYQRDRLAGIIARE